MIMVDEEKVKILKAVANENRFLILKLLRENNEMSVGDLAEKINSPIRSMSKDLRILRKVNLVNFRNHFANRLYSINTENFSKELLTFIDR
jgi:DNA-binding transcriptional ArsR family regulator